MSRILWMALLCLLLSGRASATQPDVLDMQAHAAYEAGQYPLAASLWGEMLGTGPVTAEGFYNLGNAAWRSKMVGLAIWAWRQAELLAPRDADVRANLEHARKGVTDKLPAPGEPPAWRALTFWAEHLSLREHALLTLTLNLLFWAGLTVWWWRGRGPVPLSLPVLGGVLLVVAGVAIERAAQLQSAPGLVVLHPEVTARSGTDSGSVALFYLHEGAEVTGGPVRGGWRQVQLGDGRRGWVQAEFLGEVDGRSLPPSPSPDQSKATSTR